MGWAVGWDANTGRFRGYGVPAYCEDPDCMVEIDRGLSYACGGWLGSCGRYFCEMHLTYAPVNELLIPGGSASCQRCLDGEEPYSLKAEHPQWLTHVLNDETKTWAEWRSENPGLAEVYRGMLLAHGG